MAIVPTGAIYKSLVFDGESSRDYGIYITGQAVYNAPERDVEMINIPGRNGSFALDKGRFQNIEVTYPAGIFADNEADFAQGISDFRNFLCSRNGYVRLTDDYNPNEYRMAVYKSGLDVSPAQLKAGEFDITFDCKPQRYLLSGEEPQTIGEWRETETASGSIASFEAKDGDAVKSLVVDIEPMQSGSGTPSPTNVRPISGYDSVVVSRCGKNICPNTGNTNTVSGITFTRQSDGSYVANGTATARVTFYFPTSGTAQTFDIASSQYILNGCPHGGSNDTYSIVAYLYKDGSYTGTSRTDIGNSITIDATNANGLRVAIDIKSGTTVNSLVFKPMMRLASETNATYEPYQGATYTTALNGTRYGGSLNMSTGVLKVDRGFVTFDGSENWSKSSLTACDIFTLNKGDADFSQSAILSAFEYQATQNVNVIGKAWLGSSNTQIRVGFSAHGTTTLADFKTWLGSNNVQLCYPLATPTTVQLTAEGVELLAGTNNIWADSGDVTVEYGTRPSAIYNPTLFESSPMLEVEGYGNIQFNGYGITINDVLIGEIQTSTRSSQSIDKMTQQSVSKTYQKVINYSSQAGALESGDKLFISSLKITQKARYLGSGLAPTPTVSGNISGVTASGSVWNYSQVESGTTYNYASYTTTISIGTTELTAFTNGSYSSTITSVLKASNNTTNGTVTIGINITNTASGILTIQVVCSGTSSGLGDIYDSGGSIEYGRTYLYSTRSILGSPLYVDCDLGEAYKYEGETIVSINQHVDLGSDLPKLASGANEITYDNTVTDLKVVPRWWKI